MTVPHNIKFLGVVAPFLSGFVLYEVKIFFFHMFLSSGLFPGCVTLQVGEEEVWDYFFHFFSLIFTGKYDGGFLSKSFYWAQISSIMYLGVGHWIWMQLGIIFAEL